MSWLAMTNSPPAAGASARTLKFLPVAQRHGSPSGLVPAGARLTATKGPHAPFAFDRRGLQLRLGVALPTGQSFARRLVPRCKRILVMNI